MNREVHHDFTLGWALEVGFAPDEARAIAEANWACDRIHTDLAGKRFHWAALGARLVARSRLRVAIETGDLVALGEALHATQDAVGHGFWGHLYHWPGIDRWSQRGLRVRRRLEAESLALLTEYRRRRGLLVTGAGSSVRAPSLADRVVRAREALGGEGDVGQAEMVRTLNEVADAVSSAMSVEAVLDVIVERAKRVTNTDKAVLVLTEDHTYHVDPDTIVVRGRITEHAQPQWQERLDALAEVVFTTGEPVLESRPGEDAVILASPLHVKDRPIGLLCAINSIDRPFSSRQVEFVRILSAFAAAAIENARLAEQSRYVLLASERDRIAREMHDGVVQSLFSISLGLEVCKKQVVGDPEAVAERLEELQSHLNTSMTEPRRFIYDLRPMKLTELGVVGATEFWVSEITKGTRVRGRVVVEGELPPLDAAREACLYRVAKEAVSNIVRHAQASGFEVRFTGEEGSVVLSIADDGTGFAAEPTLVGDTAGLGLRSISERVATDGGTLTIESAVGRGTVLTVTLPVGGAG